MARRERLWDDVERITSDGSVLFVDVKKLWRELRSARAGIGTFLGQVTEIRRTRGEAEQKLTYAHYELNGVKGRITQLESRESGRQVQVDHIVRQTRRLRAYINRPQNCLIGCLQLDMLDYLTVDFAALGSPTTNHRGQLAKSAMEAGTQIADAFRNLVGTIEGLRSPAGIED